jgi:hypothetical protein
VLDFSSHSIPSRDKSAAGAAGGYRDITAGLSIANAYTAYPRFSSSSSSGPALHPLPSEAGPSAQLLMSSPWPAEASESPDPQCL